MFASSTSTVSLFPNSRNSNRNIGTGRHPFGKGLRHSAHRLGGDFQSRATVAMFADQFTDLLRGNSVLLGEVLDLVIVFGRNPISVAKVSFSFVVGHVVLSSLIEGMRRLGDIAAHGAIKISPTTQRTTTITATMAPLMCFGFISRCLALLRRFALLGASIPSCTRLFLSTSARLTT